jgi:protein O-mannosyl-transferase
MKRRAAEAAAAPPIKERPRNWAWLQALAILCAGLYVFGPAIAGGWLWDDNQEVTENAVLRDPAGLAKIWTGAAGADYFPLKTTVQWFAWRLWGDAPAGYHALSVACHLLSAFLFWWLLRKLGVRLAWLGGLLFAVHPVAVESVAWAAELKNTLSLPLLLLAMIAYVGFSDRRGDPKASRSGSRAAGAGELYGLSVAFFLLAMLAKSSVAMFPVVILLYGWWKKGRITAGDVRASVPFFAVSLGLGLITLWFQHHRAMQPAEIAVLAGGPLSRVADAGLALAFYLGKSVLPIGLSPIYPRWHLDPPSLAQFTPWLVFAILFGWLWRERAGWSRPVLFALGFFVVNLLPVLGFVTFTYMKETWVADHFAYVSLLGVIGLALAALDRWPPRAALAVALTVAAMLTWESRGYAAVFHDQDALWTYTIRQNPDSVSAHYNLATYLAKRGESQRAVGQFEETLRLRPAFVEAYTNLGNTYFQEGRIPEAGAQYEEALRLNPAFVLARVGLGNALASAGRLSEAATQYEEALRLSPGDPRIEANLNIVRQALRQ